MKNIFLLWIFIGLIPNCFAQAIIGKSYITNANYITVISVDDSTKKFKIPLNTKFRVDGINEGKGEVIISFWHYGDKAIQRQAEFLMKTNGLDETDKKAAVIDIEDQKDSVIETTTNVETVNIISKIDINSIRKNSDVLTNEDKERKLKLDLEYIGPWSNYLQFKMELKDLNNKTMEYFGYSRSFTYGVMTLPVKVRFGNGDNRFFNFEENLNLGFTFGYRYQPSSRVEQAHNLLGGFGISRVKIDSTGFSEEIDLSDDTAAALMINVGYLYQHKTFQVGLFLGSDFIPSTTGKAWR